MNRQALEEGIEQPAAVAAAGAPGRQAAGDFDRLHGKVRQVGDDQAEAAAGDRQPHVALMQLGARMSQLVQQQGARIHRVMLDIHTAEGIRTERAKCGQHDCATRADLQNVGAAHTFGIGAQDLDERRGIFARPQRRHDRMGRQPHHIVHAASRWANAWQTPSSGNSPSALR
jgi:hypothetical protein